MYISEASGHHSATLAIEKAIKMLEPEAEVLNINAFNYTNPMSEKVINRIYLGIIKKTPKIWDYLYDNPKVKRTLDGIKEMIHQLNSPKLKTLFDRFKPDAVACSQAFPCGMVADFKKTYNCDIPLVAVLTDYVPHSYWIYETVNYYIAPCEEVKERLMQRGVDEKRIKTFGIPFDPKFNLGVDKKAVIKRMRLDETQPIILIMGGGQGFGPIKTIIRSLKKIKIDLQEIIIAGINKKLYKSLKKGLKKYKKRITLLEYVEYVDELMAISKLIITKPGGVTTAEALAKGIPMIIIKPIPGQEENNTAYLISKGAAVKVENPHKVNLTVEDLLLHPKELSNMSDCAKKISKPDAALDIAGLLLDLSRNAYI